MKSNDSPGNVHYNMGYIDADKRPKTFILKNRFKNPLSKSERRTFHSAKYYRSQIL